MVQNSPDRPEVRKRCQERTLQQSFSKHRLKWMVMS